MTEWNVIGVVITLLGLFITVGTPVIKLNSTISKLIVKLDTLNEDLIEYKKSNKETVKRIWQHNDEQDEMLNDHETRLKLIEKKEDN